jgi:hypothetical protein
MNKLLCFGINDYPGTMNDLEGCVADVELIASILKGLFPDLTISIFRDKQCTVDRYKSELKNAFVNATKDSWIIIAESHHGTQIRDISGDEADYYDEAICMYDGEIIDDEIRELLNYVPVGVHVVFIIDCCFSDIDNNLKAAGMKARFMKTDDIPITAKRRRRFLQNAPVEVVFGACREDEVSYETEFEGITHGVLTWYLSKVLDKITLQQIFDDLDVIFPYNVFPQHPYLAGTTENKNRILLEPEVITNIDDIVIEPAKPTAHKYSLLVRILSWPIRFIINLFKRK